MRGVDQDTGQAPRNDTSARQRDDPAKVNPRNHAPVNSPPRTSAETNTDGRTRDTLGSRDGERETRGHDDGDGGAELHGETARGRVQRDAVAELAHHVVAVEPETDGDGGAAVGEDPDGDVGGLLDLVGALPDDVDGGEGADGVGDVVGAVREGGGRGGQDLEEGVGVLGLVVVVGGGVVDGLQVTDKDRRLGRLVGYDILVNTREKSVLGLLEDRRLWLLIGINRKLDVLLDASSLAAILLDVLSSGLRCRGGRSVGLGFSVLEGLVVVGDNFVILWLWGHVAALEKKRTVEDMVPLELPIILDEKAVEVWQEEDGDEKRNTECNTQDGANNDRIAGVLKSSSALPDDKHY